MFNNSAVRVIVSIAPAVSVVNGAVALVMTTVVAGIAAAGDVDPAMTAVAGIVAAGDAVAGIAVVGDVDPAVAVVNQFAPTRRRLSRCSPSRAPPIFYFFSDAGPRASLNSTLSSNAGDIA